MMEGAVYGTIVNIVCQYNCGKWVYKGFKRDMIIFDFPHLKSGLCVFLFEWNKSDKETTLQMVKVKES